MSRGKQPAGEPRSDQQGESVKDLQDTRRVQDEVAEQEQPTREISLFDLPPPPAGLELPPVPFKAYETQPVGVYNMAATMEYSPELHQELQDELAGASDTPREEPFPGLDPRAVPRLELDEGSYSDLHLSPLETALFFQVDGAHTMEQIMATLDEPTGSRLLGLLFELWRARFVIFEVPTS